MIKTIFLGTSRSHILDLSFVFQIFQSTFTKKKKKLNQVRPGSAFLLEEFAMRRKIKVPGGPKLALINL